MAIPLPGQPGQAFLGGLGAGSKMLQRLMQQRLAQQQEQRLGQQSQQDLELRGQQEQRLGAMLPFKQRLAELQAQKAEMGVNPAALAQYIQGTMGAIGGMGQPTAGGALPQELPPEGQIPQFPFAEMGLPQSLTGEGGIPQEGGMSAPPPIPSQDQIEQLFSTPYGEMAAGMGGIPEPESLKDKRQIEINRQRQIERGRASVAAEKGKLIARKIHEYHLEIPQTERMLTKFDEVIDISANNPHLFGAGTLGTKWGGVEWRSRNLKTPEDKKNFGKIQKFLNELVGTKAADLSTRGLQVAFKLAQDIKPSLGEAPEIALAKLLETRRDMREAHEDDLNLYEEYSGAPWKRKGSSMYEVTYNPLTGRVE